MEAESRFQRSEVPFELSGLRSAQDPWEVRIRAIYWPDGSLLVLAQYQNWPKGARLSQAGSRGLRGMLDSGVHSRV